jgi:hypothetical protein
MKKTLCIFICSCVFTLILPAQTAQEVVSSIVKAHGGPDAIHNWFNYQADGEMIASAGSVQGTFSLTHKSLKEYTKNTFVYGKEKFISISAYDGHVMWSEFAGEVTDQPSLNTEVKARHTIDLLLKQDVSWSLGKNNEIDGKMVVSLEAEQKGKKTVFRIDPARNLVLEIVFKDIFITDKEVKGEQEWRLRYADYQTIDGVPFPMTVTTYVDGQAGITFRLRKVTFNPTVSDTLFQRPNKKVDLRYYEEMID